MVVFKPLSKELLWKIFKNNVQEFLGHWKKKHPDMKLPRFTPKKVEKIIDEIYDPAYGARPIDRYIHNTIEPELIEEVMKQG